MYGFILSLYLVTALLLIIVILFQKSPGIALQAKSSFSGPRARGNFLTKLTGALGFLFMMLCLLLTRQNIQSNKAKAKVQVVKKVHTAPQQQNSDAPQTQTAKQS